MVRGITSSWRHPTLSSITSPTSSSIVLSRHISVNHKSVPTSSSSAEEEEDTASAVLNKTTTDLDNIGQVTQLKPYQTLETAKFESLGTPPTLLSIHSPPSVPIYLRRGALLSIYGLKSRNKSSSSSSGVNSDDGPIIRNSIEYPQWWKRLILTGKFQTFQKLISTIPISLLISSKNKSNSSRYSGSNGSGGADDLSFVNLILDGLNDWAVLNKDAIQVYTGNSLSVSVHSLPRHISKKFAKQLGNPTGGGASSGNGIFGLGIGASRGGGGSSATSSSIARVDTGLRTLWNRGYTLLSGRGQVGLVGNGGIYQLDVGDQEEILINKRAILAITVNGPFDLENCILRDTSTVSSTTGTGVNVSAASSMLLLRSLKLKLTLGQATTKGTTATTTATPPPPTSSSMAYYQLKHYWFRITQYTKSFLRYLAQTYHTLQTKWNNYSLGTNDFVKVVGPRNILIQSSFNIPRQLAKRQYLQHNQGLPILFSNGAESQEVVVKEGSESKSTPKDYLSYVTIDPKKGAVFANTSNFKQTVDEIEHRKL